MLDDVLKTVIAGGICGAVAALWALRVQFARLSVHLETLANRQADHEKRIDALERGRA